jgi:S1-C subfamily serine protease
MNAWMAPAIGTALGLSLAAAAAALVLPEKPVLDIAPLVQRWLQPRPVPDVAKAVVPPAPVAVPAPSPAPVAAAPRVQAPPVPRPAPPPVAEPDPPFGIEGLLRPPPGTWYTGTGFFVTSRGTLLTAEHVVRGCAQVRVMSPFMRPENARILATDARNDVAVLEIPNLASPGWLAIAPPSRDASRLLVLGFPHNALPDTPNETWARMTNASFGPSSRVQTDASRLLWFRSTVVTHGYSGGPVVDVASGRAVGMVFGGIDTQKMPRLEGQDTVGLKLGPGAVPMLALLSQWAVREGVVPVVMGVESALELTRKATVRVVCTK